MNYAERAHSIYVPPEDVAERFWGLKREIHRMGTPNEDGSLNVPDEIQAAFHQGFEPKIGDPAYPFLNYSVAYVAKKYPKRSNTNIGHNFMRAAQSSLMREQRRLLEIDQVPPHYPLGMEIPERWDYFFDNLERDSKEQTRFIQNLDFNTQTNVPERYALPWAGAILLGLGGQAVNVMDMGCSRMAGLHKFALPRHYWPWQDIKVVSRQEADKPDISQEHASEQFMQLLNQSVMPVANGIGIDKYDATDTTSDMGRDLEEFSFDCLYPSEYRDKKAMVLDMKWLSRMSFTPDAEEMRYWFRDGQIPRIGFFQGDITSRMSSKKALSDRTHSFDHNAFQAAFPAFKADIIIHSTVAHQLGKGGLRAAEANEAPYTHDGTVTFLLDFIDTIKPDGAVEFSKWQPYTYKLYARPNPKADYVHLFTAENGRVSRIIVEEAAGRLALEQGFDLSPDDH